MSPAFNDISAVELRIFKHNGVDATSPRWVEITRQSEALVASTEDTPYGVARP
jgi:hypothetical protein